MSRDKLSSILGGIAALGFFVAAALHTSAYNMIAALGRQGPPDLAALTPAAWLAFTAAMLVLGGIVAVMAPGSRANRRPILALAGCFPLATAALQLKYLGFQPPVAILSVIGLLSLAAAFTTPGAADPRQSTT